MKFRNPPNRPGRAIEPDLAYQGPTPRVAEMRTEGTDRGPNMTWTREGRSKDVREVKDRDRAPNSERREGDGTIPTLVILFTEQRIHQGFIAFKCKTDLRCDEE